MCPGKGNGNAAYQVPVDEEAAAAELEAMEAMEVAEFEAADADAEAARMRERTARLWMRSAAALLLADVRALSGLIRRTQYTRAMLASAIDRLHEAAHELNLPISGAGWIMPRPLEGAGGPAPGSIDAARRIVGRLCGVLLPQPGYYLQIYECWYPLKYMANVCVGAEHLVARCAESLRLADGSTQRHRWRRRLQQASDQPGVVRRTLMDAQGRARTACSRLFNLVEFWHADGVGRMDRPGVLALAEDDLHTAVGLMDQALTAMRLMHDSLELQAYELMILTRHED